MLIHTTYMGYQFYMFNHLYATEFHRSFGHHRISQGQSTLKENHYQDID